MDEDDRIKQEAEEYARAHKKEIVKEITNPLRYKPDEVPLSVFMAGAPGAGKTEYSKNVIELLEKDKKHNVIRIDGDELRRYLPGYTGANSYLFQGAVSILVDGIHDAVLAQKQTFLLDGTLSKDEKAFANINRSLDVKRKRPVFIFYVYQHPVIAWKFTQAREVMEGRNIPKEAFIEQFINSRETITRIREVYDENVVIYLVKKNFETHEVEDIIEIDSNGRYIDQYLGQRYTQEDLERLL